MYSESAGVARIMPSAVAVPETVDALVTLVGWAAANGHALIPRGAGSSMAGGAIGAGVIVDLGRLAGAPVVDATQRRVRAGAAITRQRVEDAAATAGLTFPVDPSSGAFATVGGMCATNAAGARSVRYGATRQWVHALECVFADGTRGWVRRGERDPDLPALRRFAQEVAPRIRAARPESLRHAAVRKESSGYALAAWRESGDTVDLLVGSEGTLACIVAVEFRLAPRARATSSLLAGFPDIAGAAAAALRLSEHGATAVELLDRSFLEVAASEGEALPLPPGLDAVLIVEAEGASAEGAHRAVAALSGWCDAGGATHIELALSDADEHRLWALRHAASPILNRLAPRLQNLQLVEDGCVPPARFAEYVRGVRESLHRARFRGVIFGHAGDAHAHVNALVDVTDRDWRARAELLLSDVTALVVRLGGTLAGEHGDGRLRTPLLGEVWNAEARDLFAATKRAFDPTGILNPGVKVPLPGARALEAIKYDPALPPLPIAARAALDLVVRERAWERHRLDLIPTHG